MKEFIFWDNNTEKIEYTSHAGLQEAHYFYKNEYGNSSPNELYFEFEQLGEVEKNGNKLNIIFYGDWEHNGFIDFCHKISEKYHVKKMSIWEELRLKLKQCVLKQ